MNDDFIEIEHVYLIDWTSYDMVAEEGRNKGDHYKGWTYSFLLGGVQKKVSSDKVDLRDMLGDDKEPIPGKIRLGIKQDRGSMFKVALLGFDAE